MTLGQLLKEAEVIQSGGQAKYFLSETPVEVDGVTENRRGRKLYDGMIVKVPEFGEFLVKKATPEEAALRKAEVEEKARVQAIVNQMNSEIKKKKKIQKRRKQEQMEKARKANKPTRRPNTAGPKAKKHSRKPNHATPKGTAPRVPGA